MDEDLKNPLVSIIMLSYNRAKYIGTAIESVLNQNFDNWELLIIDGGSRDNTESIIAPYLTNPRIQFIKQSENHGITTNRNLGLKMAVGTYIAVLDSDDVWIDPEKLTKQLEFLKTNKDHVLLGSNFERIDESGRVTDRMLVNYTDKDIRHRMLMRNEFGHSSVVYRKVAALRAGGYDSSLFIWEDYDLWLRLGQIGKLANLTETTTAYRLHSDNISSAKKVRGALTMISIIKRHRHSYPNFYLALFKGGLRVLVRAFGL